MFKSEVKEDVKEEVSKYEEGLSKSRVEFTSKLGKLSKKYRQVTEDYFDELEEILIMADIGVNTVMEFMDRLRKRVKSENITDTKYLNEAKKDYKLLWYVSPSILDSIEVDHFMRRMSDKDVIDTLEAIRPFAKNLEDRIARLLPKFDARIDF